MKTDTETIVAGHQPFLGNSSLGRGAIKLRPVVIVIAAILSIVSREPLKITDFRA